jgi:transposase-like protein
MSEQTMTNEELARYVEEQLKQGKSKRGIARELGMADSTLRMKIKPYENKGEQTGDMKEQSQQTEVHESTQVQESTNKNIDFTSKEIKVLKQIVKEHESNIELFHEYQIYKELEKVPVDAETVRSAFNMSKETTERLKKYSQVRRIPLQDLVELAVLNLLNKYDK